MVDQALEQSTFVETYRGHDIRKVNDNCFVVCRMKTKEKVFSQNFHNAWSCVVYIDEYLMP